MKLKRALAVTLITIMAAGAVACGETTVSESGQETGADTGAGETTQATEGSIKIN